MSFGDSAMKPFKSQAPWLNSPGPQWLRMLQRVFQDDGLQSMSKPVLHPPSWETPTLPAASGAGPQGRCVMVVDDNPVNLLLACELLSFFSLTPVMAADGAEAVALASELRLDVILMDLQMPVLDGVAATRQIRHFEHAHRRHRVPVVAYSSSAPPLHLLQSFGIDDVLDKPCGRDAMQGCLQRWCPQVLPADSVALSSWQKNGH